MMISSRGRSLLPLSVATFWILSTTSIPWSGYAVTKMESHLSDKEWTLHIYSPMGNYKPITHYYSVSVFLEKKPKLVTVAGKFVDGWKYDETLRCLTFDAGQGDMEIVVKM